MAEGQAARATARELVSAVAHELRSPLAAIRGAAAALRAGGAALDSPMRDRLVRVIADGADQLGRLVDDLLAAGAIEAGRLAVACEPCDMGALAERVADAARAASGSDEAVRLSAPPDLPLALADPARLRQVLANLVDNALRHGGGHAEVALEATEEAVRVTVADDGPGIPEAERERVFEPFSRLPGTAAPGTGLGLYLARELTAAMGGRLRLEPSERGARFELELPRADGGSGAAAAKEASGARGAKPDQPGRAEPGRGESRARLMGHRLSHHPLSA